jgi:type IV secretion system protein VirB1
MWADEQPRLRAALSCYYSGNFESGFRDGYVDRVLGAAAPHWHAARRGNGSM